MHPVVVTRALPGEFRQWYRWRYEAEKVPEYQVDEAWDEHLHGLLDVSWPYITVAVFRSVTALQLSVAQW